MLPTGRALASAPEVQPARFPLENRSMAQSAGHHNAQNPRIWQGNDGEHRASYEVTARTVKFLGKREGNGGAPVGEPPPGGEDDDLLPF
jgi:hypothetical protein